MSTNQTNNYKLPLWGLNDLITHEEFNEANQKIDEALSSVSKQNVKKEGDTMTGELNIAPQYTKNGSVAVGINDDGSGNQYVYMDNISNLRKEIVRFQIPSQLNFPLFRFYNRAVGQGTSEDRWVPHEICEIKSGFYTGTGTFGTANPNILIFDDRLPRLLFLESHNLANSVVIFNSYMSEAGGIVPTQPLDSRIYVFWDFNAGTVSWHNTYSASAQLNQTDVCYRWFAIF